MPQTPAGQPRVVNMTEVKSRFSQLVNQAGKGEVVLIRRHGKVVAQLVAASEPPRAVKRVPGFWKGRAVYIAPDFDEPDLEMAQLMEEGPVEPVDR